LYGQSKTERSIHIRPSLWATAFLAALSVLWFLLMRANIQIGQQLLLPIVLLASYAAFYGVPVARRCLFPIAYLYFAIPIWGAINGVFQWGTVFAVRILLRIFGIPVYFQGSELHLPSGVLSVEGGCSGLHFFVVAMAIAVLYWRVNAIKRPVVLLAFAAGLAVFTNWLRVFVIAIAGYLTNMQHYLIRVDHYRFGWVLFGIAMGVFFFFAARMSAEVPSEPVVPREGNARSKLHWSALVLFAVVVGPLWQWTITMRDQGTAIVPDPLVSPPGWSAVPNTASTWKPIFANADYREATLYIRDSVAVEVFRAMYTDQRQEKKLAGFENSIVGAGHKVQSGAIASQSLPGFSSSIMADASGKKWLVLHSYFVGERRFVGPIYAQVFYGLSSIFERNRVGVLAVRSECVLSCEATEALLSPFIRALSIEPVSSLGTD